MKKLLLISALSLGSVSPLYATHHSGFHAGLQGGYALTSAKDEVRFQNDDTPPLDVKFSPRLMSHGLVGGLFLGYTHVWSAWALGLDASFQTGGSTLSDSRIAEGLAGTANLRLNNYRLNPKYSTDLSLKLGRVMGAWMPYIRLGVAGMKVNASTEWTNRSGIASSASNNKFLWGLKGGVGAQYAVDAHWRVGAEFNYTCYQKISLQHTQLFSGLNYTATHDVRPGQAELLVKVAYAF